MSVKNIDGLFVTRKSLIGEDIELEVEEDKKSQLKGFDQETARGSMEEKTESEDEFDDFVNLVQESAKQREDDENANRVFKPGRWANKRKERKRAK